VSAYANDPRVTDPIGTGALFHVTCCPGEGPTAQVRRFLDGDTWVVWLDDEDAKAEWREFSTADEAIHSLIGDPQ
jgi:hypothetical protein